MEKKLKTIYICFPEGKNKVLTMSYDDGRKEDRRLVEIFNKYGIKGTFHLNSGIDWDNGLIPLTDYTKLYKGHEIACHTYTHPNIERMPTEQVVAQVYEDRKTLETVTGYPVRGMSYPFGVYNEDIKNILKSLGIKYSRIVGDSENFSIPKDYYEWKPTCHHSHKLMELGEEFAAISYPFSMSMMYVWGHSYEFTSEEKWKVMEDFCKFISKRDDIWYATNIQIVDYIESAGRLQYAADSSFVYNPSIQAVWLSVEDKMVEIPGGCQVQLY